MDTLGGAMCEGDDRWYVVQTKRHRERVARSFLANHYETYLPMIREQPPPRVGADVAPMFPCYLFVRAMMPEAYYRISRTACVKDFVRIAGAPGMVSEEVIGFLRAREDANGVVRWGQPLPSGCTVEIVRGALQGLEAVVENQLPSRERVRVLLSLFQRPAHVDVPLSWVKRRG